MENIHDIKGIKLGNTSISKIMLGEFQVWPRFFAEVDINSLSFSSSSDSAIIQVTSNCDDMVFATPVQWITLSSTGNQNDVELTISVEANSTGSSRTADVLIYNDTEYLNIIHVEQGA